MVETASVSSLQQKRNLESRFFDGSLLAAAQNAPSSGADYYGFKQASLPQDVGEKVIKIFRELGVKDIKPESLTYFYCDKVPQAYLDQLRKSTARDRAAAEALAQSRYGPTSCIYRSDFDGRLIVILNRRDIDYASKKYGISRDDVIIHNAVEEIAHAVVEDKFPIPDKRSEVIAQYVVSRIVDPKYSFIMSSDTDWAIHGQLKDLTKLSVSQVLAKMDKRFEHYWLLEESRSTYRRLNHGRNNSTALNMDETFTATAERFFNGHIRNARPGFNTIFGGEGRKLPKTPDELIDMFVEQYSKNLEKEAKKIMKEVKG